MLQIPLWRRVLIWSAVALGLWFAMPNGFYTKVELHNDALLEIERTGETETLIAQRRPQYHHERARGHANQN